jgi:hypothetical protein
LERRFLAGTIEDLSDVITGGVLVYDRQRTVCRIRIRSGFSQSIYKRLYEKQEHGAATVGELFAKKSTSS